jgi:DNA invertase Pin-like site-specific DNA recombinase
MNPKVSPDHLKRRAIVYIRQFSPGQVIHNQESQRRQYGLADHARQLGFQQVEIIDEDLGRSGSGQVERPGFEHLVAEVCTGQVGAVLCIEASRLARNGRDWHHLIELCGLVRAIVIDPDGVYDPAILNDRLLLGLKGTMSEFELNLLKKRSLEAIRQKARRGVLQFRLPVGFRWTLNGKVEMDPDRRVQEAIRLVFAKLVELGKRAAGLVVVPLRKDTVASTCFGLTRTDCGRLEAAGIQHDLAHGAESNVCWRLCVWQNGIAN